MRAARLLTAEEFQDVARDERWELVDGRIVPMTPVGFTHNALVGRLTWLFGQHVYPRNLGSVGPELGVKLKVDPDTVLAPDVAFIRRDRIKDPEDPGFWKGPPDVAIEVKSPSDSMSALRRRAQRYLAHGTPVVLLVDPKQRTVSVQWPDAVPVTLKNADDVLDLDPVVPGFRCTLAEVFGQA